MNVYGSVLGGSGGSGKVEYSMSEKEIGTWINGEKLYQRTYTGTFTNHQSGGVEQNLFSFTYNLKSIEGYANGFNLTTQIGRTLYHYNGYIRSWSYDNDLDGATYYITVRYTK